MYSQAFTAAWLLQRSLQAKWAKEKGYPTPETDRLLYITTNLKLETVTPDIPHIRR